LQFWVLCFSFSAEWSCSTGRESGIDCQWQHRHSAFFHYAMTTDDTRSRIIAAVRILLCAATLFIIYEATIRQPVQVSVDNGDKFLHSIAFFFLALLTDFAFPTRGYGLTKLLPLLAFGIIIELVQSCLPWRSADVADFLADCVGIAAFAVLLPFLRRVPLISDR
jgi:VanZ family protein